MRWSQSVSFQQQCLEVPGKDERCLWGENQTIFGSSESCLETGALRRNDAAVGGVHGVSHSEDVRVESSASKDLKDPSRD